MRPLDPRPLRYARSARAYLALTIALGWLTAGLVLAQALLLARAITDVFHRGAGLADLGRPLALLLLVALLRAGVSWAQESAAHASAADVKRELRERLLAHVLRLGPGWLVGERTAELAVLATRGLDGLEPYLARYLPQVVLSLLVPLTVLVAVALQDPFSALILVITLPLVPIFGALVGWATERAQARRFAELQRLAGYFLDLVRGLPTLKVFGRSRGQTRGIREQGDAYRRSTMAVLRISFVSSLTLELLATISVALVAVTIGVRLVAGELGLEAGLAVLLLTPEAYLPLRLSAQHFHASQEGLSAAGRVLEILETPPPPSGRAEPPDPARARISVEDVAVARPGRPTPTPVRFSVAPGETVALVGPNGAGKSTLLAVLLGFLRPTSGRVVLELDGQRVDLAEIDPERWRARVAWVPQTPHLFAGTVAENVRIARPAASEAEVRRALEAAGADFVAGLPEGLATALGEGGAGLSEGERQRLALARAFLRDAPVVLLDEPTASLDGPTERRVVEAVARLAEGRTVVLVAHRPSLLALADRVVRVGPTAGVAASDMEVVP